MLEAAQTNMAMDGKRSPLFVQVVLKISGDVLAKISGDVLARAIEVC